MGFRTDVIEIPLRAGGDSTRGDELEYKVRMRKDATFVYEWSVPVRHFNARGKSASRLDKS
jgi:hypothetical protein